MIFSKINKDIFKLNNKPKLYLPFNNPTTKMSSTNNNNKSNQLKRDSLQQVTRSIHRDTRDDDEYYEYQDYCPPKLQNLINDAYINYKKTGVWHMETWPSDTPKPTSDNPQASTILTGQIAGQDVNQTDTPR